MKKKHGFTLVETMAALIVLGILFAATLLNLKGIMANRHVAKFKKGYAELEKTVSSLVNDQVFYGDYLGFKRVESVTLEKVGEVLGQNPDTKFRDCFKYHKGILKDNINCNLYNNGSSSSGCFKTEEGIVWGIPDTDFVQHNTVTIKDDDGDEVSAVPITIYLDYKDGQTAKTGAIVAFVTYNAKIFLLKKWDEINCSKNENEFFCNLDKYIEATSIRTTD